MAEISREEAIKKMRLLMHKDIIEMSTVEYCELMNKAISDMEKVQKIEKVIDTTLIAKEPYKVKCETIEQIVKEVE